MGVSELTFGLIAANIGMSMAGSLLAAGMLSAVGRLRGLNRRALQEKISEASEAALGVAYWDFVRAFPKGEALATEILDDFFKSDTAKKELEKVILTDHQIPNLHTLYQAFLEAGYNKDMLPGFDFDGAMNAFMGKFREELADVIQHRRNEEKGVLKLYLDQVAEHCGRLDFVGIPELKDKRGLRVDEIFVTLRAREEVPEADILPEEEMGDEDAPEALLRRARGESGTREAAQVKLDYALKDNDKVLILGGPGAGKTTMLRYVALMLAQDDGRDSEEKLGLSRELVPIFLELGRFADRDEQGQSLVEFMYDYMNTCLSVSLPPNFFKGLLDQDRCVVLMDSLDEVATLAQRVEVKNAVTLFANRYRGNRFVVTSRSAGYREAPLNGDFAHFTVCDFTEEDIKDFAGKWYRAREGDTEDAQSKADDLVKAIKDNRRVAALARNPLMLTIIALIHRIEAKLPNQRIKLYDKCTESLLYTWEAVKRRGEELTSDEEKRSRCERIAYWMQDMPGTGERERTVRRGELQEKLARILREEGITNMSEARAEAKHFLDQIRRRTGVLIERGRDLYSFAHLTFQEYFATCEVYNRLKETLLPPDGVDRFWDEEMKHRLHDTRWQEAILLFMGKVSVDFGKKGASDLVRRILEARSPYDDILHRDLLLAGRCLVDDVAVDEKLRKRILDGMFEQFWHGKYRGLRSRAMDVLTAMRDSRYEYEVAERHIKALRDDDSDVRSRAAEALGKLGIASEDAIQALIKVLGDRDGYVRSRAASALAGLEIASGEVVTALIKALGDDDSGVRSSAAEALGGLGTASGEVVAALVRTLGDDSSRVRYSAAYALGGLGTASGEVLAALMNALGDNDSGFRYSAAEALGRLGTASGEVVAALIGALGDDDSYVRSSAASALGRLGTASGEVVTALMNALVDDDSDVRSNAASALGGLGTASGEVVIALIEALEYDEGNVRSSAAYALGRLGRASGEVVAALIKVLGDGDSNARLCAAYALGGLETGSGEVVDALIEALGDGEGDVRSSAAYALGRLRTSSGEVVTALINALEDDEGIVRSRAASALGELGTASEVVIKALISALGNDEGIVRSGAASAFGKLGRASEVVIKALINALGDDEWSVRSLAAYALRKLASGSREAMKALLGKLEVEKRSDAADAMFEAVYSLAGQEREKT